MPVSITAQLVIIAVATALFLTSAVSGVERGIKWLSSFNLVVAALLALAVLLLGPTVAIIDTVTTTLGNYLSEFVRMSLRMTPFRDSTWVGGWTVFYWAWWISWSPFVGLFIARVSRGRTIREFILGAVLARRSPTSTCRYSATTASRCSCDGRSTRGSPPTERAGPEAGGGGARAGHDARRGGEANPLPGPRCLTNVGAPGEGFDRPSTPRRAHPAGRTVRAP